MNRTVLFVDDVADWREMLSGLLTDHGYSVKSVESAADAMRVLEEAAFDMAIIDIRLDETDESNTEGLTLAKSVKQKYPGLPVVILTGYGTPDITAMAMKPDLETGQGLVDKFIEKDNIAALPEIVRSVVASEVSPTGPR